MNKGRVAPSIPAEPHLRKELRDAMVAADLLNYAAAEGDPADFLHALRKVAEANGGIGALARRTKLNRQQLYKTLSADGNPEFRTLWSILKASGYALAVAPRSRPIKGRAKASSRGKDLVNARDAAQIERPRAP